MSEKKLGTTGLNALVTKIKTAIAEILDLIDDKEDKIAEVKLEQSTSASNTYPEKLQVTVAEVSSSELTLSKAVTGDMDTDCTYGVVKLYGPSIRSGISTDGSSTLAGMHQFNNNNYLRLVPETSSAPTGYSFSINDSDNDAKKLQTCSIKTNFTEGLQVYGDNIHTTYLKMHYTDVNSLTKALAIRFPYATYFGHGNATIMTAVNGYSFILNIGFYKAASASIKNIYLHVVNSHNNAVSNYYIPKVYYDNTASSEQVIYLVWNTGSNEIIYRLNCLLACNNYNSVTVDTAAMATATAATELGSSNYFANPWYDNTGAVGSSTTPVYVNANGKILAASSVNADTVDNWHISTTAGTNTSTIYML